MKCRGNRNIQLNPLDKPEPIEGLGGRVVGPTTPSAAVSPLGRYRVRPPQREVTATL